MQDSDAGPAGGPSEVVLETDRLRLRPWRISEAAIMHSLWAERDPTRIPPHRLIDPDGHPNVAELEDRIRSGRYQHAFGLGLPAVELKTSGAVIGYVGLIESDQVAAHEPEIAFELLRRFRGLGYATEAANAVVDWAARAGHQRLWATVRNWNLASLRVLDKLGFIESGRIEPDETYGDTLFITKQL